MQVSADERLAEKVSCQLAEDSGNPRECIVLSLEMMFVSFINNQLKYFHT